jgi:hypothetical protein
MVFNWMQLASSVPGPCARGVREEEENLLVCVSSGESGHVGPLK